MSHVARSKFPYQDIVADLLRSVMAAQACLLEAHDKGDNIAADRFAAVVNKRFSWLATVYKEGENRHLFDAPEGLKPLRTAALRKRLDPDKGRIRDKLKAGLAPGDPIEDGEVEKHVAFLERIRDNLRARLAPDDGIKEDQFRKLAGKDNYWQEGGTRISEVIRRAVEEDIRESDMRAERALASGKKEEEFGISIRSPLSIVFDLLTAPDMPGTRAYALMAVRNHLFMELGLVPSLLSLGRDGNSTNQRTVGVRDIQEALSLTWTYLRPRYESQGDDKLAVSKPDAVTLVRHFMAMKGVLRFRFSGRDGVGCCIEYLRQGRLRGWADTDKRSSRANPKFKLEKSEFAERLPEAGELVNELLGLPLPIRGADTVLRGGLMFAARKGLVMAIHGGPGTGKTSLALALGAYLAPFGIRTLFLSGEEATVDLRSRLNGLVPDGIQRLDFFPSILEGDWIRFANPFENETGGSTGRDASCVNHELPATGLTPTEILENQLSAIRDELGKIPNESKGATPPHIPPVCRAVVVFDGLHDLFANTRNHDASAHDQKSPLESLHELVKIAREVQALVILTTGKEWVGDARLDYLVDISIRLDNESVDQYGAKPDRRLILTKARHQLCATGTHGLQIAGSKGVRFSPQINYQLDRRLTWKVRLPDISAEKRMLLTVLGDYRILDSISPDGATDEIGNDKFIECPSDGASIFRNSHVFINGQGSGGKAGLAMKIAVAPTFRRDEENGDFRIVNVREKVLVVSFLYPKEYYEELLAKLQGKGLQSRGILDLEYRNEQRRAKARIEVIHLYPGHLKTNDLYNRIEWELEAAKLNGDPYTCVIIDGIHNVFLQFPEIQRNELFWPQIYSALRTRPIMTITTHTTLSVPKIVDDGSPQPIVDDGRSIPLRHALVQKTDFQIEVDPAEKRGDEKLSRLFKVKVVAAIGQQIPTGHVLWSREKLVFVHDPESPCLTDHDYD